MASSACSTSQSMERSARPSFFARSAPPNVGQTERWASMALGGSLLLAGLIRGRLSGLLMAVGGGTLLYRGMSGQCSVYRALGVNTAESRGPATSVPAQEGSKVEKTILIQRSSDELFRFWRRLENLPRIMENLISVEPREGNRSHWKARGPMNTTVEWDAEIHNERENELIAWRSLPGSEVDTAGSVHFEAAPAGRGTRVRVALKYNPPAGRAGAAVASFLGADVETQIEHDLGRFKERMEASEFSTTEGQFTGPQS